MRNPYDIVNSAKITEKNTAMAESLNKYVFDVDRQATKKEIEYAIAKIFGKKVLKVNTMRVRGKDKRMRYGQEGRKRHWKKAIVTLEKGEKIDLV